MANKVEIIINADGTRAIKAMQDVGATATATGKSNQEASKATALAAKYAGDTIKSESVKIVAARKAESLAAKENAQVASLIREGFITEAAGATMMAASYQRLTSAKLATAVASEKHLQAMKREGHEWATLREHLGGGMTLGGSLGESMAGMASIGAVIGAAMALKSAVTESLEFGEAMKLASEKTGLAVGTLSVLHYTAKVTGGDFDSMTMAVSRMGKVIGDATEGNKRAGAFMKSLGLDAKALADSPNGAEVAFQKFAVTLAATENPIRRNELAMALLGRGGAAQIPMLIELGSHWDEWTQKTKDAGRYMTELSAKQLEAVNQKLKAMGEHLDGAKVALAEGFTPALGKIIDVIEAGKDPLDSMNSLGQDLAKTFAFLAEVTYSAGAAAEAFFGTVGFGAGAARDRAEFHVLEAKAQLMHDIAFGGGPAAPAASGLPALGDLVPSLAAKKGTGADDGFGGVGNLTTKDPNIARLKGYEAQLAEMKTQTNVSVQAEFDYWAQRIAAFKRGSEQYDAVIAKEAELAVAGAKAAHGAILKYKKESKETAALDPKEAQAGMAKFATEQRQHAEDITCSGERWAEYNAELQRTGIILAKNAELARAFQIEMAVKTGAMSRPAAARAMSDAHATDSAAKIAALQATLADLTAALTALDPNSKDYGVKALLLGKQMATTQGQITEATGQGQLQAMQDKWAVFSSTAVGGAVTALGEFAAAATDSAALMKHLIDSTLSGVNDAILNPGKPGSHRFKAMGLAMGKDAGGMALRYGEGMAIKGLGKLGVPGLGGKRDGSSATAALYVQDVGAAALGKSIFGAKGPPMPNVSPMTAAALTKLTGTGADAAALGLSLFGPNGPSMPDVSGPAGASSTAPPIAPSLLSRLGSQSTGSIMQNLLGDAMTLAVPFLDTGTNSVPHDMLAMVHQGEAVVPKKYNQPGGGGGATHNYYTTNVDARQTSNPALMAAHIQGAIEQSRQQAVRQSIAATRDLARRRP